MFVISLNTCSWQAFPAKPDVFWVMPGAYPKVEHLKSAFSQAGSGLTGKHSTGLERLVRYKHSSLLRTFVNSFITLGPVVIGHTLRSIYT